MQGNFQEILAGIERAVLEGSMSASEEDGSDFFAGDCRCAVRVYERYSMLGGNRVSMNLTLLQAGGASFVPPLHPGQPGGLLEDEYLLARRPFGLRLRRRCGLTVRRPPNGAQKKENAVPAPEQGGRRSG